MAIKKKYTALIFFALASCTVGPDFTPPDNSAPSSWFRSTQPQQPSVAVESEAVDPKWWDILHDPLLNQLVDQLASQNIDVQTATAQLEESRAQLGVASSGLYPQIMGNASYTNEKLSDKGVIGLLSGSSGANTSGSSSAQGIPKPQSSPPFNVYQAGFDVSWEIDLWGRVRRGVEAANANLEAAEDERRAVLVSTIAELVRDYIMLRGTQAEIEIAHKNLADAKNIAYLAQNRAHVGLGSEIDVANARAQEASTSAQLPPLEQQQQSLMNAIALLLAQPPGALENPLAPSQPIPTLPTTVPVGVPSELLERRPDIKQAKAQLHAATAEIGVAKADFFPQVTLMGDGMLQSLHATDLATWAARAYSFGPSVSLPVFEGGRLTSTLDMRTADQKQAALQYRKIVLTAFHEVDNALTSYRAEQQRTNALSQATAQNRKALKLAQDRYAHGLNSFIEVLTDEQNLLAAQRQYIQSVQNAATDMAQLYKALGGGWEATF